MGEGARTLDNYDHLVRAAFQLFRSQAIRDSLPSVPLDIIAAADESGWHFELSNESKARIPNDPESRPIARVDVPLDVADDFRRMYGELYPFVVEWVTNISRDELTRLGGVRIVHKGVAVWKWPP